MFGKKSKLGFWIGLVLVAAVVWWWLRQLLEEQGEAVDHQVAERSRGGLPTRKTVVLQPLAGTHRPVPEEQEAPSAPTAKADDLRRIEGIGPKISSILQGAGITTFEQLAVTGVEQLRDSLQNAGIRLADPTTWSEQADLAAKGQWDQLKTLQGELKGGRRV